MPFEQFLPRPLTTVGIHAFAPVASGVYGISNGREWVYIGEANNIQASLLAHLQEPNTPAMRLQPTGFVFEACDRQHRPGRQDGLVREYDHTCKRRTQRPKADPRRV